MKKFLSVFLSAVLIIGTFTAFSDSFTETALAADYAATLKSKGFPESYIKALTELHKKYPNWIFEPLKTGIKWSSAVKGERSSHSKQLIEKSSYYDKSMYCSCSSCYKNGKYVIQEGSNWVSASEKAVAYYMDPRNWLDEKNIFQFESTSYDGTQTTAGVEAILDGTWMHNSLISYKTTSGASKQYDAKTRYSDAIMTAANDSGMSAYYLASKIRQENGGTTASATAVKGTVSPFQGMYNYYNIGAYTGAMDGLAWAAGFLKTNSTATLYSEYDKPTATAKGTKTTLSSGQYLTWMGNYGSYYRVRLYYEGNGYTEGKNGYILKSNCRTTYIGNTSTGWGRPWTNPYKSIYYGAKYIAQNYKDQNSGYLQKFNVNPNSDYLYSHEYMANVSAAVSESQTTYAAYKKANILSVTKKFVIPVFNNMPNDTVPDISVNKISGLKATGSDSVSVTIEWDKVSGADGYNVQVYRGGKWTDYSTVTANSLRITGLGSLCIYKFRVRAFINNAGIKSYGSYSSEITKATRGKITGFKGTGANNSVTLTWDKNKKATGYRIYKYSPSKGYVLYKEIKSGSTTSITIPNLKGNTNYKFKMYGFRDYGGSRYTTFSTSEITVKTKNNAVTLNSAKSNATKKITVKWSKLPVSCSGYQVMWSTTSNFSKNFLTVNVSNKSASKTLTTAQSNKYYYVKVRAYKTSGSKKTYYSWSNTIKVKVK